MSKKIHIANNTMTQFSIDPISNIQNSTKSTIQDFT
jgi:hypothetical protein